MDIFRRPERRTPTFEFSRVLVPLLGIADVDDSALKVTAMLLVGREGVSASLLHVLEVPFERNL
ncbi:MAG: hypothetical protein IT341_05790, partial [Chloroflexi bacterium]|nr:hypothetical protein [Chloroflexota bacterium]